MIGIGIKKNSYRINKTIFTESNNKYLLNQKKTIRCAMKSLGIPSRVGGRSSGPLVPWSAGPLVRWSSGPLVLVRWSPAVRWSTGPLVPWSFGPSSFFLSFFLFRSCSPFSFLLLLFLLFALQRRSQARKQASKEASKHELLTFGSGVLLGGGCAPPNPPRATKSVLHPRHHEIDIFR